MKFQQRAAILFRQPHLRELITALLLEERRVRLVEWWAATKATVAHKLADAATRYWDADDVPANDCVAEKLSASQEAAAGRVAARGGAAARARARRSRQAGARGGRRRRR